ncbi:hypothetical protein [Chryseobacterium sp.]|uniref:hypothetical protein n=1 Tax=Chryseobacterium sp. TaxID=1871047 RepID=UPI0011C7B962|nr:hypothetical protein [Chryseobacterium sp.]TXF79321.1 hypothetical protein FUA25_02735 [Chryseobacterium sp.]
MKLYYTIWVDCILRIKSQSQNRENWKFLSILFMGIAMSLNFIVISIFLSDLNMIDKIFIVKINFFIENSKLNSILGFIMSYFLPALLLNYSLVFYNRKYERLIEKYKYHNGRYIGTYLLISFLSLPIYALTAFLLLKLIK